MPLISTPMQRLSLRRMEMLLVALATVCLLAWYLVHELDLNHEKVMPVWLHTMAEIFAVSISILMFGIVWNAYNRDRSGNILILGIAALGVGLLDIGHLMSYSGMPDFITPASPGKGITFWLGARILAALAVLAVALRPARPLNIFAARYSLLTCVLALTGMIYWVTLFHPDCLPVFFVPGAGLSPLKIGIEIGIAVVLAFSAVLLLRRAEQEPNSETVSLFVVAVVDMLTALCFTSYLNTNDIFNFIGHTLKILAYAILYRAGFVASVREPFQRLSAEVAVRKRAEAELNQLNATLEQRVTRRTAELEVANRELEAFSYSVSHDLRAPLRAIEGFSQALQKNQATVFDERGRDYLARIHKASERMSELIDDLLYLSRISLQDLRQDRVDLSALAASVAASLRQSDPARPDPFIIAPGMQLAADAKLLRILLENLMGNAWKFSAKNPAARIEVGMNFVDGERVIHVRDNGAGFNMDYAHKLFSPFQRLHSASEFEGTGIGLATVQRIVQRHGGRVWADAQEWQGACFYFTLESAAGKLEHA